MMEYQFTLEKYKGRSSRYPCPQCNHLKRFTRYIDTLTGNYLAEDVGRCDRELHCGYHYTPKQFFINNPAGSPIKRFSAVHMQVSKIPTKFDLISENILKETLCDYERNNFVKFLQAQFGISVTKSLICRYFIGTWADGRTVFWQIDERRQIRTGKLMTYDAVTGKRVKNLTPSWVHAELKKPNSESFSLEQCFFGEHLLSCDSEKLVAIVESEKTAIVASIFKPDSLWLATGGCGNLKFNQLLRAARGRRVELYPDSSKFENWSAKGAEAKRLFNLDLCVSDLLEQHLTDEQKREDYDIADFLLAGMKSQIINNRTYAVEQLFDKNKE